MIGAILFAAILFTVVSALVYYKSTDTTKSVPVRIFDSVKLGALAVSGYITAIVMQWSNQ